MKDFAIYALHVGGKIAICWIAYLAMANGIRYGGWFVFAAVAYTLFTNIKVDTNETD